MPVITGTAYWAKVHQPHFDQYNEQGIFSIDVTVDAKTKKQLQDLGVCIHLWSWRCKARSDSWR